MKRKIIIILTSVAVIIGVYVTVDRMGFFKKENKIDETTIVEQIDEITDFEEQVENVNKEEKQFTTQEIESITKSRDPFDTPPTIAKQTEQQERKSNELKAKVEKRIKELEAEENKKKQEAEAKGETYETNPQKFEQHVKEEIDKILKEEKKNTPSSGKTETGLKDENLSKDATILDITSKYSKEYGIDQNIILAIIGDKKASDGKLQLRNPDGTYNRGLMQISTKTAKWLAGKVGLTYKDGIEFDNNANIKMGTYYLKHLKGDHDNIHYMLTAYYVGPGGAERIKEKTGSYESDYSKIILNRMN